MATRKTPARTTTRSAAKAAAPKPPATRARKAAAPPAAEPAAPSAAPPAAFTPEQRYRWIAQAAYLRAERRGFAPGHEVEDWLAAEAEFEASNR